VKESISSFHKVLTEHVKLHLHVIAEDASTCTGEKVKVYHEIG